MPCPTFKIKFQGQELLELIQQRQEQGDSDFDIRMFEMESAKEYGIPFDEHWYSIPLYTREIMIAGRLGRHWIDMLNEEEIMRHIK
jgi:hypothetical protein